MKTSSFRIALPLFAIPGAFLLVPGCGGGNDTGPGIGTPTPTGTRTATPTPTGTRTATPTPTTGTNTNIALGQAAFAQAITGFQNSNNTVTPAVRASVQSAVTAFQNAATAAPNSSDANAGLAASLLAQTATDPNSPFVKLTNQNLLQGSSILGLDNIVSLRGMKAVPGAATLSAIKDAVPNFKRRAPRASIGGIALSTIQNYISSTELPRMQRVAAALAKVNKSATYSFAVYRDGNQVKKLYGPDLAAAQTFAKTGIALLATTNGYNLDPGNLFNNVSSLADLDTNRDRKVTPLEYTGNSSFLKLRSDGAANLTLALAALRETANLADSAIRAEAAFNAPADALIRLTSAEKQELRSALPYVTQVKAALAGASSYPVNGSSITVNISEFYTTPLTDLRQGLPTVSYNTSGDITGYSFAGQNATFGGLFPDGTASVVTLLNSNS